MPIDLIGLLAGKDVLVGAIDVASDRIETPEDVAATLRAAHASTRPPSGSSVHQLRHGAAVPGRRPGQAAGAGGRGGARPRDGTAPLNKWLE